MSNSTQGIIAIIDFIITCPLDQGTNCLNPKRYHDAFINSDSICREYMIALGSHP